MQSAISINTLNLSAIFAIAPNGHTRTEGLNKCINRLKMLEKPLVSHHEQTKY